jgi:hypothetical protein
LERVRQQVNQYREGPLNKDSEPEVQAAQDWQVDPYKDGRGALDKAGHYFFFTEILRGTLA